MAEPRFTGRLSPIELAKSVAGLAGLADTRSEFEELKQQYVPSELAPRVDQVLDGLAQEDEFAVLCKAMGTCSSIVKLDQSPIIQNGEIPADFLASFSPGVAVCGLTSKQQGGTFSCLIEVKSCAKKRFKISNKDLQSRRRFAKRYGLPLVFAIRFREFDSGCLWVWEGADHLERTGRIVEATDLLASLGTVLLDDYCWMPTPAFHFINYYNTEASSGSPRHHEYGYCIATYLLFPGSDPVAVPDQYRTLVAAVLAAYDHDTVQIERDGPSSAVVSRIENQMRPLSSIIYFINHLASDPDGAPAFDARRLVSRLDGATKPTLVTREMVEFAIGLMNGSGPAFFRVALMNPEKQRKTLAKLTRR